MGKHTLKMLRLGANLVSRRSPLVTRHGQERLLNIHEYQSVQLMRENGVHVPSGVVATNVKDAMKAADKIMNQSGNTEGRVVVKAQIHAGGRGLGKMLLQDAGKHTSAEGRRVETIFLVEPVSGIEKEMYFAILLDRATQGPMLVGSPHGGMNIEDVAANSPDQIYKEPVNILEGLQEDAVKRMAKNLGFSDAALPQAEVQIRALYDLFIGTDATQVEINPLIENDKKEAMCLDAKLNFDDNAAYRQQQVYGLRDPSQEDPR